MQLEFYMLFIDVCSEFRMKRLWGLLREMGFCLPLENQNFCPIYLYKTKHRLRGDSDTE